MKLCCYDALDKLPQSACQLVERQSADNLFLSMPWFQTMLFSGIEAKTQVQIFTVEHQTSCLVVLFMRSPAGQNGSKFARWLKTQRSLASLTNFQSSHFAIIVDETSGKVEQAIDCLTQGLTRQPPSNHAIDINLMDADSFAYQQLKATLTKTHFSCQPYVYKGNWYEKFTYENFSDYLQSRDKSAKKAIKNYQRKYRKFQREQDLSVALYTREQEYDQIIKIYQEIYQQSWKEPDYFEQFYPELIKATAKNGSLRFLVIFLAGKPVAFEFAIVTGKQCVMMRTAYITKYQRESIGSIAIMLLIEYAIEQDKITELDFGTDDDSYKKTWVSQRRERCGLICFNSTTLIGLGYLMRFCIGKLERRLKAIVKKAIGRN